VDLEFFTESFETYDLTMQRVRFYGMAFPFLRLLLGLGLSCAIGHY